MKVEDYHCGACARRFQLKAKSGSVGATVANSAYDAKLAAIRANRAPDYAFLGYDAEALVVQSLFIVPGHFITEQVISRRAPLKATARRAGWVGSNIHLSQVPQAGKISVIKAGRARPPARVREEFRQTLFLASAAPGSRGWMADVMACIDRIAAAGGTFSLAEVYNFAPELGRRHPDNRHVKDKIRQQVQRLRDVGYLRFLDRGQYQRM